ncbi:MAG: hypothetical protein GF332_03520 [Candidatus Moranbacteria bacterium]|nr:hypothetical protein [Candidatus Moranbacteria bacterium]
MNKTNKLILKRIKAKTGKLYRKKSHQSHYNANDRGEERRDKRGYESINGNLAKNLARHI